MAIIKKYRYYFTSKKFLPLFLHLYQDKDIALLVKELKNLTKNKDYRLLVAFADGKPIAMASVNSGFLIYVGKYLQISSLYVDKNYRNMGIAKFLLKEAELFAKEKACQVIFLNSYINNNLAHDIYVKEGFTANAYNFIKKSIINQDDQNC